MICSRISTLASCAAIVWLLLGVAALSAQEDNALDPDDAGDTAAAIVPPTNRFEVELLDGTLLRGEIEAAEIEVTTKYGQLKIPLTELQSVEPGLSTQRKLHERVMRLIEDLGGDDYEQREKAQQELAGMGPKISQVLKEYTATDNEEQARRARAILDKFAELERTWGATDVNLLKRLDEVKTSQFTASGEVQVETLTVHGLYGTVQVKLENVKAIRRATPPRPGETFASTKVGGENVVNIKTFDSEIKVRRGDTVSLRAGGTIKRGASSSYVSRPDGTSNFGYYSQTPRVFGGALLMQLGPDGPLMTAGSRHTFTADKDGTLRFTIGMPTEYAQYTYEGEYEVDVRISSN